MAENAHLTPFFQPTLLLPSPPHQTYDEVDLATAPAALAAVKAASGLATVPQVFVGGRLLGGADDTVAALTSGALAAAVSAAGGAGALPAGIAVALGAAARGGGSERVVGDAGLQPAGMDATAYAALKATEARMAGVVGKAPISADAVGGASFSREAALAWLTAHCGDGGTPVDAATAATTLDNLMSAHLLAHPYGPAVDDDAPLLLARRARAAPSPLPLNARFAWAGPARPPATVASDLRSRALALYDAHLASDGRGVDYRALAADPAFSAYTAAAAELQAVPLASLSALPPKSRFALFVNLYNSLIVHAIAERGGPGETSSARSAFFGGGASYNVGGLIFSADDIEHGVLRGNRPSPGSLGGVLRLPWAKHFSRADPRSALALPSLDPRLHAALNCGARSCPPIKVYAETGLDEALDGAMGALCGDASVNEAARTVTLSSIFKWYGRDFEATGATPLLPYLARYLPPAPAALLGRLLGDGGPPPRILYAPYDWDANAAGVKD